MNTRRTVVMMTLLGTLGVAAVSAEVPPVEIQVAGAVAAAPEDRREGAAVLGYDQAGALVSLREGSNELVCIADNPADDKFRVACYHQSLESYMQRGRELRAEGLGGAENLAQRHQEADDGKLKMPQVAASLYNLGGDGDIFDSATGEVSGGNYVWSVYIPYLNEEASGLPTTPQAPGAPWIMRAGTASAHIMVVQPRPPVEPEEAKEPEQPKE